MNSNAPQSAWRVCLLGALNGLIVGCSAEFIREAYGEYQNRLMVAHFETRGMSPPLVIDMLHWWAIPFTTTIAFILVALIVHRVWAARLKSSLLLWELIGVAAVIVWGLLWQAILWTGPLGGSFSIITHIRRLQSGYTLTDLIVSGSFLGNWLALLLLVIVVNLVFGALLQLTETLYRANRVSPSAT